MAKASDNLFPKVKIGPAGTVPSAPSDSSWSLYTKADGVYARSSNTTVGPFASTSPTTFPGYEYAYAEVTSPVSITATTAATANTVVTAGAVTFDGGTIVLIEFYAPYIHADTTEGRVLTVELYDGSSDVGHLAVVKNATTTADYRPVYLARRLTPSAASHTYGVRAYANAGAGAVVGAGAAGSGAYFPAFIRITRA